MKCEVNEDLLIQIFVEVDDDLIFLKEIFEKMGLVPDKHIGQRRRTPGLTDSEIIAILVFYHYSGMKNFMYYYQMMVLPHLRDYFPKLVCYERFLALIPRVQEQMFFINKLRAFTNERTGIAFVDSKPLKVCHNRRIHAHKVFKNTAARGKSSLGWFYGHKLHLIINHLGDILNFEITPGNVSDNNPELLKHLFKNLIGKIFGDKGYISQLNEFFRERGLELITKIKSNMKNKLINIQDKLILRKRGVIESVLDILTSVQDIEHTRHRSPANALCHVLGGLIAYDLYPEKPSIILKKMLESYP